MITDPEPTHTTATAPYEAGTRVLVEAEVGHSGETVFIAAKGSGSGWRMAQDAVKIHGTVGDLGWLRRKHQDLLFGLSDRGITPAFEVSAERTALDEIDRLRGIHAQLDNAAEKWAASRARLAEAEAESADRERWSLEEHLATVGVQIGESDTAPDIAEIVGRELDRLRTERDNLAGENARLRQQRDEAQRLLDRLGPIFQAALAEANRITRAIAVIEGTTNGPGIAPTQQHLVDAVRAFKELQDHQALAGQGLRPAVVDADGSEGGGAGHPMQEADGAQRGAQGAA